MALDRSIRLVLGGPGTGKTHRLIQVVRDAMTRGISPDRIAFVSFTKQAADEAATRAMVEFKLTRDDLPYFRTLHSVAFRELGLNRNEILTGEHLKALGELTGFPLTTGKLDEESHPVALDEGDRIFFMDNYARSTRRPLEDVWGELGEQLEWVKVKYFSDSLEAYKRDLCLVDFTDMLEEFAAVAQPLPIDLMVIDEAQDLNPLQWAVVEAAAPAGIEIWVAGDDDQSIYKWAGADVHKFLNLNILSKEVLPISRRLPRSVFTAAASVIKRVRMRYAKQWEARDDEGTVEYHREIGEPLDLSQGSWLLLARNNHFLHRYMDLARQQGVTYLFKGKPSVKTDDAKAIVAYEKKLRKGLSISSEEARLVIQLLEINEISIPESEEHTAKSLWGGEDRGIWHDALTGISLPRREYYLSVLRRGGKLLQPPTVRINTIHASKGAEADNVVVMTDMTKKSHETLLRSPDEEHRVFYVGMTRARENLHIVLPQTSRAFPV